MTMLDYYKMSMKDAKEFTEIVKANGKVIGTEWDADRYSHNDLIEYNSNVFSVNSYHGIVNIK